uniref:Polymerase nucleotidyl transferase domain-containing protein n=1 Tax=Kalanchoe fedtschenkoi TaxID=63787 RepID=A0A7N0VK41_KALFE
MSHLQHFWPPRGPESDEDYYHRNPNPNHYGYFYNTNIIINNISSFPSSISYASSSSSSSSSTSPLPLFNPDPFTIPPSTWAVAEDAAIHMLSRVHPTLDADQKRKDVTDYLETLITSAISPDVQLFPYGSVPLKTYLPDGDIDLTALSSTKTEHALASEIRAVLEKRQYEKAGHYEIHDVQFIDAEVKLVKCLVQNIVVDISFNQLGGICTLCFLEQVDRLIGRNHLFKRSIILIKAWCYYESRILGAHHGLISTYALETLVLYIFNMFHSSIDGPVAVLYRFLDYFSKFDWDNYCISLNGPVPRAALPDISVDIPEDGWSNMLLSAEFLKNCVDMFSVPSKDPETNLQTFTIKHLNIIDPLKVNNNLGRSVHRGNFYRICSALRYGARKLGWILSLPRERLSVELKRFFLNSLERHGNNYWDDIPIHLFPLGVEEIGTSSSTSSSEGNSIDFGEDEFSEICDEALGSRENMDCYSTRITECHADGVSEDDFNQTYTGFVTTAGAFSVSDYSVVTCDTDSSSHSPDHCYSPKETDMTGIGHQYPDRVMKPALAKKGRSVLPRDDTLAFICSNPKDGFTGNSEEFHSLLDLTGDYERHIRSLLYGLNYHGYTLSASPAASPFKTLSRMRNRYQYESIYHSSQFKQIGQPQRIPSTRLSHPSSHHCASSLGSAHSADKQKFRGTGTYIPNINHQRDKDTVSCNVKHPGACEALQLQYHNIGNDTTIHGIMTPDETDHWFSESHFPALCDVKFGCRPSSESSMGNPYGLSPDKLEFGSFKCCQSLGSLSEKSKHKTIDPVRASGHESGPDDVEGAAVGRCKPASNAKLTSFVGQVLELEDAAEFPPLSM